jgi:hypothetical protein
MTLMPPSFDSVKNAALEIEGMLSEFSIAVMDSVLSFQEKLSLQGHLVEFGVYRGRSAAVLACHTKTGERLLLVDIADEMDLEKIRRIYPDVEPVICPSENFSSSFADYHALKARCRFIHIDSSHRYRTTYAELSLAETLLRDRGLIVLDDFTNLDYSQILAATFKYLYTARTELCVFLVTAEKAYLCKKADFAFYARYALGELIEDMITRDVAEVCLARTDVDDEYRAIHLRERMKGEIDRIYGRSLYGNLFRSP